MSAERVTTEAMLDAALEQLAAAERWRWLISQVFERHTFFGAPLDALGGWVWDGLPLMETPDAKSRWMETAERQGQALGMAQRVFERWLGGWAPDRPSSDLGAAAIAMRGAASTTVADGVHLVALDEAEARALVTELLERAVPDETREVRVSSWPSGSHRRGWVWIRVRGKRPGPCYLHIGPTGNAGEGGGLLHHDPDGAYVAECWLPKVIRA